MPWLVLPRLHGYTCRMCPCMHVMLQVVALFCALLLCHAALAAAPYAPVRACVRTRTRTLAKQAEDGAETCGKACSAPGGRRCLALLRRLGTNMPPSLRPRSTAAWVVPTRPRCAPCNGPVTFSNQPGRGMGPPAVSFGPPPRRLRSLSLQLLFIDDTHVTPTVDAVTLEGKGSGHSEPLESSGLLLSCFLIEPAQTTCCRLQRVNLHAVPGQEGSWAWTEAKRP